MSPLHPADGAAIAGGTAARAPRPEGGDEIRCRLFEENHDVRCNLYDSTESAR